MTKRKTKPTAEAKAPEPVTPPGLPWEELTNHPAIAAEFRRRNIFTYQDLLSNVQAAHGAIQAAYGQDYAQILIAARKYQQEHK